MDYQCWYEFIEEGKLSIEVEGDIANSWKIARANRVSHTSPYKEEGIDETFINKLTNQHQQTIKLTEEYIEIISKGLERESSKEKFGMLLLNSEGYLLYCCHNFSKEQESFLGLEIGSNWKLQKRGTTAQGITLMENRSAVVKHHQHYQQRYHSYTTAAFPIQNSYGELVCVLGVVSSNSQCCEIMKAMMIMATKAIEKDVLHVTYKKEAKELNKRLNKQNKLYETQTNLLNFILNHTKEMVFIINEEGKYVLLNQWAWKFLKEHQVYTLKDVYEKLEVYDIKGKRIIIEKERMFSIFTSNSMKDYKIMLKDRPSGERYYHLYVKPYYDYHNRRLAVVIIEDITDYMLLDKMKSKYESKALQLENIINTITDGVVIFDYEGKCIKKNPASQEMLTCLKGSEKEGLDTISILCNDTIKQKKCCSMVDEKGKSITIHQYALNKVRERKTFQNEVYTVKSNGKKHFIRLNGSPIFNREGKVERIVVSFHEITKLKEHEAKLKHQKEFIDNVINALGVPVAVLTYPDYTYEFANDTHIELLCRIVGKEINPLKLIGEKVSDILPAVVEHYSDKEMEAILNSPNIPWRKMLSLNTFNGATLYYQIAQTALKNENDNKTRIIIVGMDVTSQVKLRKEGEALTRAKEDYFATISHELRSPVTVIHSVMQLLNSQYYSYKFDDKTKNLLKKAEKNNQRLLRLVNNFLDISRAEAGFMEVNLQEVNLVQHTELIIESILPIGHKKNIDIQFQQQCKTEKIPIDIEKYEGVMLNLLSNAIKFTKEKGEINVCLKEEEDHINIKVKDNGIGIPKVELDKIFDRFYISANNKKRENRGTGIGLSLVKKLMELMEGKIEVFSEEGEGSEFILVFPKKRGKKTVKSRVDSSPQLIEKISLEFSDIQQ
ncbi:ATP-binding protein [Natronincola ferrireducens]|uniref:histidine kinase n=1 Tax=Natronincola ferrireducens TaxID=393762 RepID=A0A1G8YQ34_9FIRM|nr:ATP-binding protein [Natronincola ferrireducens]SDK04883.1 PAS domain-containing protein [Natronincola ferrireducens]